MTHGPIDPKWLQLMNDIAKSLDVCFNGEKRGKDREWGFCLLLFPFSNEEGKRTNYISNANRADMIVAMKEWIARAEGRVPEEPTGLQ